MFRTAASEFLRPAARLALLLAIWFIAPAQLAQAEGGAASTKLVRRGEELRQRGRDQRALVLFRRAHELDGNPVALAQMAELENALGLFTEAREHLSAALGHPDDPWIVAHRGALERMLAELVKRADFERAWLVLMARGREAGSDQLAPAPSAVWTSPPPSPAELAMLEQAERFVAEQVGILVLLDGQLAQLENDGEALAKANPAELREAVADLEHTLAECSNALSLVELPGFSAARVGQLTSLERK